MSKEKLFSITKKDFEWDYYRAKGKGGQKKNVTDSACRCRHIPSGALATAEESRSQHANKRKAFERIIKTKEFRKWLKLEIARKNGMAMNLEEAVTESMKKIKVETLDKEGKWIELEEK
jgi:protein subunit release factor B